jgi:drug/metabolite transporter (DMT)-like permease
VSALASVAVKRWGGDVHPLSLAAVPMLGAGIAMGGVSLVLEHDARLVLDGRSVGALVYLAVVGSAVTFTVYYWLLARMPATRLALMTYLIPIVAVAVGAVLFDEPLRARLLTGAAVVLAGVGIVTRYRHGGGSARPARPIKTNS